MRALKKLLTITALALPLITHADDYVGYGDTQQAAREDLAQNILSTVSTETRSETQVSEGLFKNYFRSASHSSRQTTNVILTGVKVERNTENENGHEGGYIARLNKQQFKEDASDTISNVEKRCNGLFAEGWDERNKQIVECLSDIQAALGMAMIAASNKISPLKKKEKLYQDEGNFAQIVVSSQPSSPFSIGASKEPGNTTLIKEAGTYTIGWEHNDYCATQKKVEVKGGESVKVTQKLYRKPSVTIKTASANTKMTLDGSPYQSGTSKTFNDCTATVSYSLTNGNQTKTGTIKLKPGLDRVLTVNLLSPSEERRLSAIASTFESLNQYNVIYGYSYADDYSAMHRLKLENIKSKGALRYGYGALYGKGKEGAKEYETYIQAALQLTHLNTIPLHIGHWVIVPYAGVEVGVGYHDRYHKSLKDTTYVYGSSKSFTQDYLSLKYLLGFDFPINQNFSLKAQATKNTRNAKDIETAVGISMQF